MDPLSWDMFSWIGGLGIIFIILFLPWYLLRSRASGTTEQARLLNMPNPGEVSSTSSILKDDDPYILALRSGDPVKITQAPLPKHLTPELLLEVLCRLQIQPSLIDLIVERIRQQLTVRQFRLFVESWLRYYNRLGETVKAQNEFFSQISQRLNARLVHQRDQAILRAERDEAELRAALARQERKELAKPKPSREDGAQARLKEEERRSRERIRALKRFEELRDEEIRRIVGNAPEDQWSAGQREMVERIRNSWDVKIQREMER